MAKIQTIFVVSWLSECETGNSAGVSPKAYKTREQAEQYMREVLEAERSDWANRLNENDFKCDFERGQIFENSYDEFFTVTIKEVDLYD